MKRRAFIQTASMASLGALALSSFDFVRKEKKIGLQLYSLRDVVMNDPKGILKKVADFGYKEVEVYGYQNSMLFGMKSKEFGTYVHSLNIDIPSGHYGTGQTSPDMKGSLINDWQRAIDDAKEIGQKYMVVAWLHPDERKSIDDYKKVCELLNKAGEQCNKSGIRLNYHNHDFELMKMEGQVPYDLMLNQLEPKLVGMEMDLYWMAVANASPLDYFAKYPGRFEQWHVKDMDKNDPKKQVDVGTGRIDFASIFAKAKQSGMKHFYIEQEQYPGSSIDSIRNCILNFKNMMKV